MSTRIMRLVPDGSRFLECGIDIEVDEEALVTAFGHYIGTLKDKWHPGKRVGCVLVPKPDSFHLVAEAPRS